MGKKNFRIRPKYYTHVTSRYRRYRAVRIDSEMNIVFECHGERSLQVSLYKTLGMYDCYKVYIMQLTNPKREPNSCKASIA